MSSYYYYYYNDGLFYEEIIVQPYIIFSLYDNSFDFLGDFSSTNSSVYPSASSSLSFFNFFLTKGLITLKISYRNKVVS